MRHAPSPAHTENPSRIRTDAVRAVQDNAGQPPFSPTCIESRAASRFASLHTAARTWLGSCLTPSNTSLARHYVIVAIQEHVLCSISRGPLDHSLGTGSSGLCSILLASWIVRQVTCRLAGSARLVCRPAVSVAATGERVFVFTNPVALRSRLCTPKYHVHLCPCAETPAVRVRVCVPASRLNDHRNLRYYVRRIVLSASLPFPRTCPSHLQFRHLSPKGRNLNPNHFKGCLEQELTVTRLSVFLPATSSSHSFSSMARGTKVSAFTHTLPVFHNR